MIRVFGTTDKTFTSNGGSISRHRHPSSAPLRGYAGSGRGVAWQIGVTQMATITRDADGGYVITPIEAA